jgi:dolichol-phosphate mannosyltransferase
LKNYAANRFLTQNATFIKIHRREDSLNESGSVLTQARSKKFVRVALPAYNEAAALPLLIPRIAQALDEAPVRYDILVVNDCSKDDTAAVARELANDYAVALISHSTNKGLGGAILTCITQAIDGLLDDDIIVTMDADNSHPPQLINRMIPMIGEGRDIVVASRYRDGSQVVGLVWYRECLSIMSSWLMRFVFGIPGVRDYTCGFRAYRVGMIREALKKHNGDLVKESGFAAMAELLLNFGKLNAVIGEVPLVLRYDQKQGISKMKLLQTIRRSLAMIVRHRFS